MKTSSRKQPLFRAGDPQEMTVAVEEIGSWGYDLFRPNEFQLKIADVSYYPGTGTILVDGEKKLPRTGLEALRALLEQRIERKTTIRTAKKLDVYI
jgi:hypothetical protein